MADIETLVPEKAADNPELLWFQDGLGKAGTNLHPGGLAAALEASEQGVDVVRIGWDTDEARRAAAAEAGMLVIDDLSELPAVLAGRRIDVVDIATASGEHGKATRDLWDVLRAADLPEPKAWVLEKPVVSSASERVVMDAALDEIGRERVFVNENYLASTVLAEARDIIATEQENGNPLTSMAVVIAKDRVADVLIRNRFQDTKGLAAYGIEMPHVLAVASSLMGEEFDTRPVAEGGDIVENVYYKDVDGIEESEGTYTVLSHNGKTVVLSQPLGPFEFDTDGNPVRREWGKSMERTAEVTFADGRKLTVTFDPVPGAPRYHSKLEYQRPDGEVDVNVERDNTLSNLLGAVAIFSLTDGVEKHPLLDAVTPDNAMRYAEQLAELRVSAGDPVRVESLAKSDEDESAADFSERVRASYT